MSEIKAPKPKRIGLDEEMKEMKKLNLFEESELMLIQKKRKEFEWKLRKTKYKDIIVRYIKYEMNIMKLVGHRKQQKQVPLKKSASEFGIVNRINRLFNEGIARYPNDIRFWMTYLKFCKMIKYNGASRTFDKMLEVHSDKPALFKFAAQWELEECHAVDRARKYLLSGLQMHNESKMLYAEAFRLELVNAQFKKTEAEAKSTLDADPTYKGHRAEDIYDTAIQAIHDVNFMVRLLDLAMPYDFTTKLQIKIMTDMRTMFPQDELTWDTLARMTLLGVSKKKFSLKDRIRRCVKVYKKAVETLPSERMWFMYLDAMLLMQKDLTKLPVLKKKLLSAALHDAHKASVMPEKYYEIWIEQLWKDGRVKKEAKQPEVAPKSEIDETDQPMEEVEPKPGTSGTSSKLEDSDDTEDTKESVCQESTKAFLKTVLHEATKRLKHSAALWERRLRMHLIWGEVEKSMEIFNEATKCLGAESLPLWTLMLIYWQSKDSNKVEDLLEEGTGVSQDPKISGPLKVFWLERVTVMRGIEATRTLYLHLSRLAPPSLELHKKMIDLENIQPEFSVKHSRKCYILACTQFGVNNTDVWLDYVRFEKKHGQPSNLADIYFKAVCTLNRTMVDFFKSAYNLEC